jgi:hypothetical protein
MINRDHTDTKDLVEANQYEDLFFTEMLDAMGDAHPELGCHRPKLEERLATGNVIRLLDGLFHNHIKTSWLPRALASMDEQIEQARNQLTALGPSPSDPEVGGQWIFSKAYGHISVCTSIYTRPRGSPVRWPPWTSRSSRPAPSSRPWDPAPRTRRWVVSQSVVSTAHQYASTAYSTAVQRGTPAGGGVLV